MKLKQFSLLTLLVGLLFSAVGIIVPFFALQIYISQNGAIGIIGGAVYESIVIISSIIGIIRYRKNNFM